MARVVKVLFITRKFPPSTGGMQLFAYELSEALAAKTNIKLVKWGGSGRLKAVLVALPYLSVKAALALPGTDIIQAQDGVLAPLAYVLSRLSRKPFAVVIHGLDATYGNWLFRVVVPPAVRRADAVFCISQAAADEVEKLGVSKTKIHVVPLAVVDKFDSDSADRQAARQQINIKPNAQVLVTVGRLVKRKGVAWFIKEVLPNLAKRYPDLIYLVVGQGEEQAVIVAAINSNDTSAHVRLLGRISDEQRATVYNAADVFVMPNIPVPGDMEGFGLVLLEASTYRLPVVATNIEGIADAVSDGQNGQLVPAKDVAAFQHQIEKFLASPTEAKTYGDKSRAFTLANYHWDKIAERYIDEYQRLLH